MTRTLRITERVPEWACLALILAAVALVSGV